MELNLTQIKFTIIGDSPIYVAGLKKYLDEISYKNFHVSVYQLNDVKKQPEVNLMQIKKTTADYIISDSNSLLFLYEASQKRKNNFLHDWFATKFIVLYSNPDYSHLPVPIEMFRDIFNVAGIIPPSITKHRLSSFLKNLNLPVDTYKLSNVSRAKKTYRKAKNSMVV